MAEDLPVAVPEVNRWTRQIMAEDLPVAVPEVNRWLVSFSVVFATFMEVLDTTVVNVSLPHIGGSMSATVEEATWTLTSYLVANAIILPMTGWLANYFGRKRLLMLSVSGFVISSFLCGLAPNLTALIIFRVMQGASGGVMQPISQAIMLEAFPPAERGKAMALFGLCIVTAPIFGPVIGGWLTDSYSWRWVFYINIPVGAVSLIMTKLYVFDPPYIRRRSDRVDYWGIGMLALGMACLQILLDKGEQEDWFTSHAMTALALIAVIFLSLFVVYELVVAHPVVHLRVFKNRTYATGVFMMTTLGFVLYGSLVLLPIMLQTLLMYPALQAGIATAPRGIGSLLFMPVVGLMISRVGARKLLVFGITAAGLTLIWLSVLNLDAGYWDFFWPQFIQGIAMSCLFVPLTTITMDPIPKQEMGNATSLFNLMRNIGGSMGIAVSATLLSRHRQMHTNILGAHVNPYDLQTQNRLSQLQAAMMAQGSDATTAARRAAALMFYTVERQAAMLSFIDVFRLLGIVFLFTLPLVMLMRSPRVGRRGESPGVH
ncbi:MAG: drug resistance transporter, EmrB/QacA subfamily [Acidobacteria bacterium]|nr:drug resistance transporter, EmrB/QacA subfamily [Acidobacteriota bacterium]